MFEQQGCRVGCCKLEQRKSQESCDDTEVISTTTASEPGGLQVGLAATSTQVRHNGRGHVLPIGRVLVVKKWSTVACRDESWSTFTGLVVVNFLCATSRNGQGMG